MGSPFGYFDHQSKHALAMAQGAAVELNHPSIGPEHLLLGILRTPGPASDALRSLGIDLEHARDAIESFVPRGAGEAAPPRGLPLAPEATAVIERADALRAQRAGCDLTPSLLLVILVANDDSVASKALAKLGASPGRVREAVAAAG
ncbi:MAG: hypothetical protein M3P12_12495 [Gemmatimonadota bacterium]|nr:hypothetical protein [Gemmatimonadota bacterium]